MYIRDCPSINAVQSRNKAQVQRTLGIRSSALHLKRESDAQMVARLFGLPDGPLELGRHLVDGRGHLVAKLAEGIPVLGGEDALEEDERGIEGLGEDADVGPKALIFFLQVGSGH
jgi:hypothetical protein